MTDHLTEAFKGVIDVGSLGLVFATILGWLPQLGAILSVIWLAARVYNEVMTAVYRRRGHQKGLGNGSND